MVDVARLENDADRRKRDFENSLRRFQQRLTPREIAEEALRTVDVPGQTAMFALAHTVRKNPILTIGLAAGAGWLLYRARSTARREAKRARKRNHNTKEVQDGSGIR
jgi:ElaB/YqjD/DUF883 family membrane-anchored ribosome-binding protein